MEAELTQNAGHDDLMAQYASGTLGHGMAVLMASYVTLSSEARKSISELELLNGVLLDEAEPVSVSDDMLSNLQACLDETPAEPEPTQAYFNHDLPAPLRAVLDTPIEHAGWRFAYPGVQQISLPIGDRGEVVKLLKIKPGKASPRHSHGGIEATLVLRGAFSDGKKLYERGYLAIANEYIHHRPRAEGDVDCICLAVTDGSLFLKHGIFGMVKDFFAR